MLKYISETVRERLRNPSGGVRSEEEIGTQMIQKRRHGAMVIDMMGRRQVTYTCMHNRCRQESGQGRVQELPPRQKKRRREEKGRAS